MRGNKGIIDMVTDNMDQMPGIPLVEICDQKRVLIEHHQGVTVYGCNEIHVKARYGSIIICGENLKLERMNKEKLIITGCICAVKLQGRGQHGAIR